MKRSSVIRKIEELLNVIDGEAIKISNKTLATLILGTVEEIGMLPPSGPTKTFITKNNTKLVPIRLNEWERE